MNNKKKCINIIAYIIVVILAVFYLATLVLGSKLDVSDEYKLYYVDGELSKWPGENGLDYYFGNTEIYDISKLEEYKKLLEEQKLYGDIITDDEEEADEVNEDSVESNRDSAIDKYFQKMLAAENNYVSEDADDNSTADKDEDKTIASALNIPYRYTKGFYSLHTGIYTNKGNEAALYYRFVTRVEKDIVLEVYGASYNTDTKVYANDEYIGTITAYNETEGAVKYHKNEYGDTPTAASPTTASMPSPPVCPPGPWEPAGRPTADSPAKSPLPGPLPTGTACERRSGGARGRRTPRRSRRCSGRPQDGAPSARSDLKRCRSAPRWHREAAPRRTAPWSPGAPPPRAGRWHAASSAIRRGPCS